MLLRLLSLPVTAPATALLFVARRIEEQAMREHTNPATVKGELDRLEEALINGEIDDSTFDAAEEALLARLTDAPNWRDGASQP
ncbi:MAG: gas vesicle protein GvpG [Pseudomonadota bacterium]